jgi:hypothetical protein
MRIGIIRISRPASACKRADPGVDGASLGDDQEKAADDQDEQGDVDGIGDASERIVEPHDRGGHDREQPLRVRLDLMVGARHRRFLAERLVELAIVLTGRDDPGEHRDDGDQREQDREGGRKPKIGHSMPPVSSLWRAAVGDMAAIGSRRSSDAWMATTLPPGQEGQ